MAAGALDLLEIGNEIVLSEIDRVFLQDFAVADDGVERRAQLVAHIGEELRLVLARLLELPALVLDFVEQADIGDGDHRLVGKGRDQVDLLLRERLDLRSGQQHGADRRSRAQQRHAEHGAVAADALGLIFGIFRIGEHVRNLDDAAFQRRPARHRRPVDGDRMSLHVVLELIGAMRGDDVKLTIHHPQNGRLFGAA